MGRCLQSGTQQSQSQSSIQSVTYQQGFSILTFQMASTLNLLLTKKGVRVVSAQSPMMALDPVLVFTLLVLGSFLTATATICCYVARRQHRRRQRAAVQADTRCVCFKTRVHQVCNVCFKTRVHNVHKQLLLIPGTLPFHPQSYC